MDGEELRVEATGRRRLGEAYIVHGCCWPVTAAPDRIAVNNPPIHLSATATWLHLQTPTPDLHTPVDSIASPQLHARHGRPVPLPRRVRRWYAAPLLPRCSSGHIADPPPGQSEARGDTADFDMTADASEDNFLSRERALLGDDADQFASENDKLATVEDGDDDLFGGGFDATPMLAARR
jgi:hypothetical protein